MTNDYDPHDPPRWALQDAEESKAEAVDRLARYGWYDDAAERIEDGDLFSKHDVRLAEPGRAGLAASLAERGLVLLDDGPWWMVMTEAEAAASPGGVP
jgi:hypothetical protein